DIASTTTAGYMRMPNRRSGSGTGNGGLGTSTPHAGVGSSATGCLSGAAFSLVRPDSFCAFPERSSAPSCKRLRLRLFLAGVRGPVRLALGFERFDELILLPHRLWHARHCWRGRWPAQHRIPARIGSDRALRFNLGVVRRPHEDAPQPSTAAAHFPLARQE